MKSTRICLFTSLIAVVPPLLAQSPPQTTTMGAAAPGSAMASQTSTATAVVVGIVPETRTVTLKRADGKTVDIHATNDVRNFDQIKVGDKVAVKYTQAVSLDLQKGAGIRERSERSGLARAPVGAKPGGTLARQVTILADVEAIDKKDGLITLRGPGGHVVDLKVQDPEQLNRVQRGDQVKAVYMEALAVAVEPAPASSGR